MKIFKLPDLGEGLPDAEIREWYIKEGDEVKTDQLLVAMETAKAVVDVPAPRGGHVIKLHGKPGDVIKTGAPLIEFADGEETPTKGTVVGNLQVGNTVLEEVATGIKPKTAINPAIKAIPAIRMLAKKLNVDLATVNASGPNGQITVEDVERAAKTINADENVTLPGYEPLRGVRRAMALAMMQSHVEVVPVTLNDDADIHAWAEDTDITLRVIRALIAGCKAEPALNAWYDHKAMARQLHQAIHIGIAMDSQDGLIVPVLKQAESTEPGKLRTSINRFKEEVKARKIPADDLYRCYDCFIKRRYFCWWLCQPGDCATYGRYFWQRVVFAIKSLRTKAKLKFIVLCRFH